MYNDTNISSAVNFLEYYEAVNILSNQVLSGIVLFVLFVLIFIIFSNYDKKIVLLADSFIVSFIGILFFALNLISWGILVFPILIFLFTLLFVKVTE